MKNNKTKQNKATYIVAQGKKIGKVEAGEQIVLSKKQAAAFRDFLDLTPEILQELEEHSIALGVRPAGVNATKPAQKRTAPSPLVEDQEPGGGDTPPVLPSPPSSPEGESPDKADSSPDKAPSAPSAGKAKGGAKPPSGPPK